MGGFTGLPPDDLYNSDKLLCAVLTSQQGRATYKIVRKDGENLLLDVYVCTNASDPLNEGMRVFRISSNTLDTELKLSANTPGKELIATLNIDLAGEDRDPRVAQVGGGADYELVLCFLSIAQSWTKFMKDYA